MVDDKTVVVLEGVNGERFTLAGPDAGDRGIYLATGVTGLYDPPVKVVWEEPGNFPGSRYLSHRIMRRDLVFGVEILDDDGPGNSWQERESGWRKAWSFTKDCKLHVWTPESGWRTLKVRLGEQPEVDMFTDPRLRTINLTKMTTVAGDPFWYGEDEVYSAATQTDTRFDPNALQLPWPWPHKELPKETLVIDVKDGLNPTDQHVFPKWAVPGSTEAPAMPYIPGLPWLGAPKSHATLWTIPDYSWDDDEHANRRLRLPALIGGLRTNEVQQFDIQGRPTGGLLELTLGDEEPMKFRHNPTVKEIEDAFTALAQVTRGDVEVERLAATDEQQTIELKGGATGGKFTLNFDGEVTRPIQYNPTVLDIYDELVRLPSIQLLSINVTVDTANCEQRVWLVGEPTAGSFKIKLDGVESTRSVPHNGSNLDMALALASLPAVGNFDISVKGSPLFKGGGPWDISFHGGLAGVAVNPLEGVTGSLTGGAGIEVKSKIVKAGGRKFTVTFKNNLSGINLPQISGNPAGLTGGKDNKVECKTAVEGSHPFRVTFVKGLGGRDMPELVADSSNLIGSGNFKPVVYVETIVEGRTAPAENAVIDTDPRVEQVTSESGSQLWARMNGVRFKHYIPRYTKSGRFEITASGVDKGQMVTLRIPRPWSRPWGLE